MKDSLAPSVPLAFCGEVKRSLATQRVFLVAACAGLFLLMLNVFYRESYSGDEGFYGVTALNMVHSPQYILRPSYFPAGDFLTEKDAFAHPPFNSYFYALSLWCSKGSLMGPDVVNVLFFALLLYFAYRVVGLFDPQAGRYTTLLLAASPAILVSYSQLEAEPLMTTFGIMALYCALRAGVARGERLWFPLCGLCLGFSYALKLWLCGPLALAVAVALLLRARQWQTSWPRKLLAFITVGLAALVPAGAHLLAVGLAYPDDLGFWLKNIYFGVFTQAGISGGKLGGAGVSADWVHPFWYYAPALYRDHFFLVPILLLGLRPALRDGQAKRQLLWIIAAGLFGLLPLSLLKVKEPLYVLSCSIFIYFLAGLCLAALARRIAAREDIDSVSFKLGVLATLGLLVLFPLAYTRGIQPAKITSTFVLAHSITFTVLLAVLLWSRRHRAARFFDRSVYGACALALLAWVAWDCVIRRPRDKAITQIMRPYLQENAPNALSLIASNFKSYQFYSFRHGCYWHELPLQDGPATVLAGPRFGGVRAFILDADDLQKPEIAPWLAWLKINATEKTGDLDARIGRASGFRLFLRDKAMLSFRSSRDSL